MTMNTRLAAICLLATVVSLPLAAQQYYSTTGQYTDFTHNPMWNSVGWTNHLYDLVYDEGINIDRPVLTDMVDDPAAYDPNLSQSPYAPLLGYQVTARALENVLDDALDFTGQGKIVLDLTYLFFDIHDRCRSLAPQESSNPAWLACANGTDKSLWVACTGYGNQDLVRFRGELHPDYQARLADFLSRTWQPPTASDFEAISVNSESGCTPGSEIQAAAGALKAALPGVKVAAGYPISVDHLGVSNAINYNASKFPTNLDKIITWSYGVFAPANDAHPKNYASTFTSYYNILKGKLRWWQKIIWVVDGHYITNRHGPSGMNWTLGTDHAQAMVNWCNWIKTQSLIDGSVVFTWAPIASPDFETAAEMPATVKQTMMNTSRGICTVAS